MENERPVKITLERAKKWFKEGGELKKLALSAFSKEELDPEYPNLEAVYLGKLPEDVVTSSVVVPRKWNSGKDGQEWIQIYTLLLRLAKECNKGWQRTNQNMGWFLVKNYKYPGSIYNGSDKPYKATSHSNLKVPGIVYFKNKKDCEAVGDFLQEKGLLKVLW